MFVANNLKREADVGRRRPSEVAAGMSKKKATKPSLDTWHDSDELKWAARCWATRVGVKVSQIHIRKMTTKWASISTLGHLTLNNELLQLLKPLGEFVIVHEIVHMIAQSHGKLFKSFMNAYLPDWAVRKQELP